MAEYGESLSKREIEVLELVATGATNRQIAQDLVVSINTVKVHLSNIYTKLGVESRTEATLIAIRDGLIDVPAGEPEEEAVVPESVPVPALTEPASTAEAVSDSPAERLPNLPWWKRVALLFSLLLVVLASVAAWPRSETAAEQENTEWESPDNGIGGGSATGEGTGWRALAPMTVPRSRFALATTPDGHLIAIGGQTNGGITGAIERYDPTSDQWTPVTSSKPTRVSNIGAAAIGDKLIVPGGTTADGTPTAQVEVFDLEDETWSSNSSLPRPLSSYAVAAYAGELYLFGGRDDHGYANSTYIYDPQQDAWRKGKAMPTPRAYAAAALMGDEIYVIGGHNGQRELAVCQVYRPITDTWESCEPLTLGRGGLGLTGVANRLYAVGGGWSSYLGFSERFIPGTAEWTPFETPMSQQWRNLAVASLPDRFYVAGGWNGDYLNGLWEYVVLWHKIFIPGTGP